MNAETAKMVGPGGAINPAGYNRATKAIADHSAMWRSAVNSTGMFEAGQLRVNSATSEYTRLLEKQKLSFRDLFKNQATAKAAYNEQLRLQQMMVRKLPGTVNGTKNMIDYAIPDKVHKSWDTFGNRVGFAREQLRSASTQLVNWGKNTQWAGRQLMVGLTLPVVAFGAAAGKMAYDVDKEFTRVRKVYNTTADQSSGKLHDMIAVQQEFTQLQTSSWDTARKAAADYGVTIKDTMSVQAELAATGQTGSKLQGATTEVVKNAMLGEIDYQTATKATIAMQQQLHLSTKQLSDSWAYMNSVENSTSLQMKDFAQAIPIALGPLKMMGGDVKTLGTLLTGMVSRGIQVGKAANGIKAAAQRLLRPSKQVREEFAAITGADIAEIGRRNKGNLLGMLKEIFEVTKDLSQYQRGKALAGLFGSYQLATMGAMVDSMGDLKNGVGQISTAFKIGQQDAKQWQKVSSQEISQMAESASGKFKRAIANIQISMAEMGKPFLEAGAVVLRVIDKIFKAFNGLPKGVKVGVASLAIFGAVVGPVIMLTGLFANLAGNLLKMGVTATGAMTKFQLLNKESAAAKLAAKLAESGFIQTGTAVNQLTVAIEKLTEAHKVASGAAGLESKAELSNAEAMEKEALAAERLSASLASAIAKRRASGQVITPMMTQQAQNASMNAIGYRAVANGAAADRNAAAAAAQKEAEAAKTTNRAMKGAAISGGIFAASMATSFISSNETVKKIADITMMSALLGPMFIGAGKALVGAMVAAKTATVAWLGFTKLGLVALKAEIGLMGVLTAAGKGMWATLMNPMTLFIAGLAAAAASMYLIYKNSKKAGDYIKSQQGGGKELSEIYGYQYKETPQISMDQFKKSQESEKVRSIANSYRGVIEQIRNAKSEQDKFNQAARIGIQVIETGGTVKQAQQATKAALVAAQGEAAANQIMLHFGANIKDVKSIARQAATSAQMSFNDAVSSMDTTSWQERMVTNLKGVFTNPIDSLFASASNTNISQTSQAYIDSLSKNLKAGFDISGPQSTLKVLDKQLSSLDKKIASTSGAEKKKWQDFRTELIKGTGAAFGMKDVIKGQTDEFYHQADALQVLRVLTIQYGKAKEEAFLRKKFDEGDATEGQIKRMQALQKQLHQPVLGNAGILNPIIGGLDGALNKSGLLNEKTKDFSKLAQGGGRATGAITGGLNAADNAAKRLSGSLLAFKNTDWSASLKGAMSSTQSSLSSVASSNFDNRMNSAMESYSNSQNARVESLQAHQQNVQDKMQRQQSAASDAQSRRQDAAQHAQERRQENETQRLDDNWKRRLESVNNYYDARVKRINEEIKAEQNSEKIRQKIFDAEMLRVQRANERENSQIDFTVALNSGNLDEAAKIRNDMSAKESEYALTDASKAGTNKSDKVIDRLQNRIDKINDAKEARLKALQKEEDAEKRSLSRRQDREKRALAASQARQQKFLQTRQAREQKALQLSQARNTKHLQKEVSNNIAAQQEVWNNRKENLDKAIELFQAYVPRNEKDLRQHVARISKQYGDFNVTTKGKFNKTSVDIGGMLAANIRLAAKTVKNDIQWAGIGGSIAKKMISGAFGMTPGKFKAWMIGGKFPAGANIAQGEPNRNRAKAGQKLSANQGRRNRIENRHEGGMVGSGGGSRKGVARTNPLHSSEIIIRAQKGEYVFDKDSVNKIGPEALQEIHKKKSIKTSGQRAGGILGGATGSAGMGIGGLMATAFAPMMKGMVRAAVTTGGAFAQARDIAQATTLGLGSGVTYSPGQVAGFNEKQMRNAAIIASTGSKMGMSKRDIEIAFMTAIVESNMLNLPYGDRDSIGMFQQRNPWGSYATRISPSGSSRLFFNALSGVDNRDSLPMGVVAQMVQRSAFPGRYAQHHDEAVAIWNSLHKKSGTVGASSGYIPGTGGRHRPVRGGYGGIHDSYTGYPAVDLPVPVGTSVHAAADGRIAKSYDIRGYEPRSDHGGLGYRSYGRVIKMAHANGAATLYAHLSKRLVSTGQRVKGGAVIGKSGNTGHSYGPHLHFGAHNPGPLAYLNTGGYTANDGLAMLHKNELVVDPNRTKGLNESLDSFERAMYEMRKRSGSTASPVASKAARTGDDSPNSGKGFKLRTGTFNILHTNSAAKNKNDISKLLPRADVLSLTEYEGNARRGGVAGWLKKMGWGIHVAAGNQYADTAVAWNNKKMRYVDGGTMNINPKVKSGGGGRSRMAAYAKLQDRKSGTKFWQVATHLVNHASKNYPRILGNQMQNLGKLYGRLRKTAPVFMAGDWNATPGGYAGGIGTNKAFPNLYSNYARENFKRGTSGHGSKIDQVLTGRSNKFIDSQIVRGLFSDHDALLAQYNIPGLAKGGHIKWDNTLTNLHKKETVLTEDLSRQFKQGVSNFANGGNTEYNVNVNVTNPNANADDIAQTVLNTIRWQDNRKPKRR